MNLPVETWVQWIRDESNKLIAAIDEEIARRQDPDDPFDGTASDIFPPLQNIGMLQQGTTLEVQSNQIKPDESTNRSPQTAGAVQRKLVDVQSPLQRQVDASQQNQQRVTPVPQGQQQIQEPAGDSSQNRTDGHERQGEMRTTATLTLTQRQVEESQPEVPPESEQQTEDPFRTLRSFHEKQRVERQVGNQPRMSVSSHSTIEGAVGGAETQYPKPQRQTKKHQNQGNPRQMMPPQGNNQPPQSNYHQGPHNTTTYMELPSSIRTKICGKCGLMGHIKRFCKEEVYCKYCKIYTQSTMACRTYPATSSRKNTPEK